MVEHDDERRSVTRAVEDVGDIGVREVTNLERDTLVSARLDSAPIARGRKTT